jgi:hypothetical protein
MNQALREIYLDYKYELFKTELALRDLPNQDSPTQAFETAAEKIDKLEPLVDLYAYLLAQTIN